MRSNLIRHFWWAGVAQWLTAISCDRPQKLRRWDMEASESAQQLCLLQCLIDGREKHWVRGGGAATSNCLHSDKAMISSAISACSCLKRTD